MDRLVPARLTTPVTQEHISADTPMGANLIANGATFRVWAPNQAIAVYVRVSDQPDMINGPDDHWQPVDERRLQRNSDHTWTGFISGVQDGDYYRFYIANRGDQPYKRDPYARELEFYGYPDCDCIVRDPNSYPWHDQYYRTPPFNDLIIYQFHIGRFYAVDENGADQRQHRVGNFLDILDQIPHLVELGVNAIEPLPIVEFQGPYSLGYNGTDIFSPEMDYGVQDHELAPYLEKANQLLIERGCQPLTRRELGSQINQLKAVIDICHLYGIAVILDVVYNHAGHFGDGDQSIYFFDRPVSGDNNESLYFTNQGWAGGLVFAYWKDEVRQFLIDNAVFFLDEYHIDGLRYDEVTVIDHHGGWRFLQDLTNTVKYRKPQAIHIAEYWQDDPSWALKSTDQNGAGFDAVWYPGLRTSVRNAIAQAAQGQHAHVDLDTVKNTLYKPYNFSAAWRALQYIENHDRQRFENTNDREPRIPLLGDATDTRSWYARSRSRVANGLLLTAPGIPMLFMGQEILEDKYWSDAPNPQTFVWWDGLHQDQHMQDFYRYMCDLVKLRRRHPALRGEGINVFHVHEGNRIIAFHRWQEGVGRDVVVVVSLNESTFYNYALGFPIYGVWLEVFNSDAYDHWLNPQAAGNAGSIHAGGFAMHGFAHSCNITIPANSVLVFARDAGDTV
ncbi:MAG: 1,4-alpha-glucan branching protein [Gammaproteobacteria bacterium SG8_11]|nr:MAG: 1,4-alpha-glucan branching protein [Gammaproteobacteria bacterium SG8_11]